MKYLKHARMIVLIGMLAVLLIGHISYQVWRSLTIPKSIPIVVSPSPLETTTPPSGPVPRFFSPPPLADPQTALPAASPPPKQHRFRAARPLPTVGSIALVFGAWEQGGWTDVFEKPDASSNRLSQGLIGDRVRVLAQREGWSQVEIISQGGIKGWVETAHLTVDLPLVRHILEQDRQVMVVRAPGIIVDDATFLPFGATLTLDSADDRALRLILPDGSRILLNPADVRPVGQPLSLEEALQQIKAFRQVAYQYGGNTPLAMDDSGLIFLLFRAMGLQVPRTREDLRKAGTPVSAEQRRAGDIVFFSTFHADQPRPVILLDEKIFIEASPAHGVSLGLIEHLHNHQILEVRRYTDWPLTLAPEVKLPPAKPGAYLTKLVTGLTKLVRRLID